MTKRVRLAITILPEVKERGTKLARKEGRSLSNLIEQLLVTRLAMERDPPDRKP